MRRWVNGWVVAVTLLGVTAYCIAEEITLTTYYPSPRGVYDQLRTAGNVQIGRIEPPGDAAAALETTHDPFFPMLRGCISLSYYDTMTTLVPLNANRQFEILSDPLTAIVPTWYTFYVRK